MNLLISKIRRGITLIEIAIALAVGAIVIAGIMIMYQTAMTSSNVNRATSQLTAVISAVRQVYPSGNYAGIDATAIRNALPQEMRGFPGAGGSTLVSVFGGPITLTAVGGNAFSVTFEDLPNRDVCSRLALLDLGGTVVETHVGLNRVFSTGNLDRNRIDSECSASAGVPDVTWTIR